MQRLVVDGRWRGRHGIGRFAAEVLRRLPVADELPLRGRPTDAFDLIYALFPLEATTLKRLYFEHVVKPAGFRAAAVLTVSDHVREDLIAWSGWPAERVVVVGNGVSDAFNPTGPPHRPGFRYFFYVGAHKPHKNLKRLFTAFAEARLPRDIRLLLSGRPTAAIRRDAALCGVEPRIAFLGDADDADLAAAYRGATALMIPSLEEGFGLPALEAMACGTPVVASTEGALPEVVGDAARMVDPVDIYDLAEAMEQLATDAALVDEYRRRGLIRAAGYTWDEVAGRVYEALERAAGWTPRRAITTEWEP
jgi:glycosyltransferase involved in cell wall biosynthesis